MNIIYVLTVVTRVVTGDVIVTVDGAFDAAVPCKANGQQWMEMDRGDKKTISYACHEVLVRSR